MTLRSALRIAAFSFTLVAPFVVSAQEPDKLHTASRQELNIVKVLLAQENAWNKGDLAGFASGYKDSPDTLFVTHQVFRGFAGLVDEYKHDYPNRTAMGTLSYSDLEVHPLDARRLARAAGERAQLAQRCVRDQVDRVGHAVELGAAAE